MKHFLIYGLAAVLIFSMLGRFAAVETGSAAEPTAASVTVVKAAEEEEPPEVPVGLLQVNMSSMDDMYFKNSLLEELGEGYAVHALSTDDARSSQSAMFRKMVEKGYKLIIVELFDAGLAEEYIDLALENEVSLIFTGEQPSGEQMARMENLYYVGTSEGNVMRELADAIITGWKNNQKAMELKDDDRLVYNIFTKDDYEENGNQETLESYLTAAGIEVKLGRQCATSAFGFDVKTEVDKAFYAGGEIFICDSSSFARRISEYLHEEEFPTDRFENSCIFITAADETAQQMVEEGTAMFATGVNGGDTGAAVGRLARVLLQGGKPSAETVGIAPDQNKCLNVTSRTMLADRISTPPPAEEDEGEEE